MKEIKTEQAVGHVLCHDLTQILPGISKGPAFRKGHVVAQEDIPVLLSMGKKSLYVWEASPGMLHENEAAQILYDLCAGDGMYPSTVSEGKINIYADKDGLFCADTQRLYAINSLCDMVIAARKRFSSVKKGDMLAGTRVVPLVIEKERMDEAVRLAEGRPLFSLLPYHPKKVGIVVTGSEVYSGRIQDAFTPVLREKLSHFPTEEIGRVVVDDSPTDTCAAILDFIKQGAQMVLCTGGMSVDPDDKTPLAIKNTGARIVSYGAPVLPGAMFLLAYTGLGVPIMGLPGCVMYAKRTIFDLVLPKIMADVPITKEELAALGHGGLCLSCESCYFPNCTFGAGV